MFNKHYIRVENGYVIKGFSDAFESPLETDICINEKGGRHFAIDGEINPTLVNFENGTHLYRYDTELRKATEEEIAEEMLKLLPTLEKVKAQKKAEISAACENTIHSGIDVKIGENWEHFSLETNDQINLFGKQYQLANGVEWVEYHQDGHPCKYYSAADMMKIITAAMEWVSYHTTYCNALNMWIAGAESKDEVNTIYYGADIPEEYQSEVLKDYLTKMAAEAEAVIDGNETVS